MRGPDKDNIKLFDLRSRLTDIEIESERIVRSLDDLMPEIKKINSEILDRFSGAYEREIRDKMLEDHDYIVRLAAYVRKMCGIIEEEVEDIQTLYGPAPIF